MKTKKEYTYKPWDSVDLKLSSSRGRSWFVPITEVYRENYFIDTLFLGLMIISYGMVLATALIGGILYFMKLSGI